MKLQPSSSVTTRRTFLGRLGRATLGLSLVPLVSGCESNAFMPVLSGTTFPFLTPTDTFYRQFGANGAIDNWSGVPTFSDESWGLEIAGLVARPQTLRLADLGAEQATTIVATIRCIINSNSVPGLIGTATWTGVPLRVFLERAGLDLARTRRLRVYGADGFTDNLTLDTVFGAQSEGLPEPMLAYDMNGEPLAPGHGAPVRLIVPGHYGYKSMKWVSRIEATDDDQVFGIYQTLLGYADDGRVAVNARVGSLLRGARIAPGPTLLSGFAVSGTAPIARVEVAIDEGPFVAARLPSLREVQVRNPGLQAAAQVLEGQPFPFPGVWTLWDHPWQATEGTHRLRVRATDADGQTQPPIDLDSTDGENPVFEMQVSVVA